MYVLDRMTDVVSLAEAAGRDVARVLTNAFVDDPGWRDVGPNRARHRRLALWAYHRALQRKAKRWGRPGYAAFRSGQLVGVAVTFGWEAWPPPEPASPLQRCHVTSEMPALASRSRRGPGFKPCEASTSSGLRKLPKSRARLSARRCP